MADVRIMATGLGFPEGPVAMPDGSVVLTEIRNRRVSRIASDGTVTMLSDTGGGPNGLAIGPDGALFCCNNGGSRYVAGSSMGVGPLEGYVGGWIERIDAKTGATKPSLLRGRRQQACQPRTIWCSTSMAVSISPTSANATRATAITADCTTRCPTDRR